MLMAVSPVVNMREHSGRRTEPLPNSYEIEYNSCEAQANRDLRFLLVQKSVIVGGEIVPEGIKCAALSLRF
jgi:hypothetical protein